MNNISFKEYTFGLPITCTLTGQTCPDAVVHVLLIELCHTKMTVEKGKCIQVIGKCDGLQMTSHHAVTSVQLIEFF